MNQTKKVTSVDGAFDKFKMMELSSLFQLTNRWRKHPPGLEISGF